MRNILILADRIEIQVAAILFVSLMVLSLFSGCAVGNFPSFPASITEHYVVDVKGQPIPQVILKAIDNPEDIPPAIEVVQCLHFNIISKIPYKIKFLAVEPIANCNGVGGYRPEDSVSLYNWIEDVAAWAEDRKKCFK